MLWVAQSRPTAENAMLPGRELEGGGRRLTWRCFSRPPLSFTAGPGVGDPAAGQNQDVELLG